MFVFYFMVSGKHSYTPFMALFMGNYWYTFFRFFTAQKL
ncbi:hypothetical protein LEP1GSC145_0846 [Leptospira interrogans serovar Djasiman str. LT1649]|nr:hypothetical protein LEP1GSC148_4113 [Leptospira interrogans serovar Canicola str. LT1962]EMM92032.1 hypothetical protein LEP1GSC145_0846 [Leptospira interrogans serovar Djasiman str. LT1649]